jgi:DMSO/TMAO reductase YedYZ molybdopterin-dependent catalytic subunit
MPSAKDTTIMHETSPTTIVPTQMEEASERSALIHMSPSTFTLRPAPAPHQLSTYITPDTSLFHTMHMGAAVIDLSRYKIVIDGLVSHPMFITLEDLKAMPQTSITAFHECYGSPLKPPTQNLWRIGNVTWTGVKLSYILALAGILPFKGRDRDGLFVWTDGLDTGTFAGVQADRYQKDLPLQKALQAEVLVAYEMNGRPLTKERGGPARLVVPGWFGTNSTKWLCRISVQRGRAMGVYTTRFYNEVDPEGGEARPVWRVGVNSMIIRPAAEEVVGRRVKVEGWAWSDEGVEMVDVCGDGKNWREARVEKRVRYEWQRFEAMLYLQPGRQGIVARATCVSGEMQPMTGRRNHVHRIKVVVKDDEKI